MELDFKVFYVLEDDKDLQHETTIKAATAEEAKVKAEEAMRRAYGDNFSSIVAVTLDDHVTL